MATKPNTSIESASTNGKLPEGWRMVRFDEIAQNVNDRVDPADTDLEVYVGLEHLDPESLKINRWGTPDDVKGQKLGFREGDIIFGKRRAYQRKLAVAECEGICSAHAMVLRAKREAVVSGFLPFFMQSDMFMERAIDISVGSLSPTINWKTLRSQEFPIPPKNEQVRIAEMLLAASSQCDALQEVKADAERSKAALVRHLTSEGIGNREFTNSPLGKIPAHWEVRPLGSVVEFLDGKRVPIKKSDRAKRQGPYPYYGASGIIDYVDDYLFDEDLILVGEDGANIVDRNSAMAFKVTSKCWVNNHAHVLRPNEGTDIDYLVEYLESISYLPYKSGTAQPKLNKAACESIPIPMPPPDEQQRISEIIRKTNAGLGRIANAIDAAARLLSQLNRRLIYRDG